MDAYPVSNRVVRGGDVQESNGELVVETPPAQWACAVEVPLCRDEVRDDQGLRLTFRVCVDNGCLGIGILTRDGRAFRREIEVSTAEGQCSEFECVVGPDIGSLIIRNASAAGVPSSGKCRILTVEAWPGAASYAQFGEDLILLSALNTVDRGFYIDVGAWDELKDSVTKLFYDKGWNGINIEPCPRWFHTLVARRPRDINLCLAASDHVGFVTLHEILETGLSTTVPKYADKYLAQGLPHRAYSVPCRPLGDICAEYVRGDIHFLKIDVEGAEKSVLQGYDFNRFRPWLLVIEATVPSTQTPCYAEWEDLVLGAGYELALFHEVNRYYVARERPRLKALIQQPEPSLVSIQRRSSPQEARPQALW
jgi:FkbM family methyltransferase